MSQLTYETLSFCQEEKYLQVILLGLFNTKIPLQEVEELGPFKLIGTHAIEFPQLTAEKAERRFSQLLSKHLEHLQNNLTGNSATYIHRHSGIPLIGHVAFGLAYRNSSLIEIKPNTSCNLNCIYCSLAEGIFSKKHDFVVEKDYLVEELKKLIEFVNEPVEVHIGVQGEPFLYGDIDQLISDLQLMKKVNVISLDTNGLLLNKKRIDKLAQNNKLQINFSLDSLNETRAQKFAGVKGYSSKHVQEMIAYATKKISRVIIAPVLMSGINEKDIEEIIKFALSLPQKPWLGIQNFLIYKTGKIPTHQLSWEKFYQQLNLWEKEYHITLKLSEQFFNIHKTKELPKPFVEGDVVNAVIKSPNRFPRSVIAVAKERNISIPNCEFKKDKKIKVKIVRDKHNIFVGKVV